MKKLLIALLTMLTLFGCAATPEFDQFSGPQKGDIVATMETNMGTIKIRLFADLTPEIVKNFTTLAEQDYYDGLTFHRVIQDFMIQGGDPNGNGTGGDSYLGEGVTLADEIVEELTHAKGTISMANRGPDTNTSQFFIVHADSAFLDGSYSIFGQVYDGLSVVDDIAVVETNAIDKPVEDVVIEDITISTY